MSMFPTLRAIHDNRTANLTKVIPMTTRQPGGDQDRAVIIITGPPGVGKSTAARSLAGDSVRAAVHLHSDDFYHYIKAGWVAPYLPEAHEQNRVVIDVLADAAFGYADGGYLVFLDGIVGPWFLQPFLERSNRGGIPLHYVVLRLVLNESLRRARERTSLGLRDSAPIRELQEQFGQLGALEGSVIDTTGLSPGQTVEQIGVLLRSGRARLAPGFGVTQ